MIKHGADVCVMANKYKRHESEVLDFSSNINPIMPNDIDKYIVDSIKYLSKYPDINYTKLKKDIALYLGSNDNYIIPGNGASEIIYLFMNALKGKRIGIFNPTFSEYEKSASISGLDVVDLYLENDFSISINKLKERINDIDIVFICNPNNPTSSVNDLVDVLKLLKKHDKFLLVDETFMEFVDGFEGYSLIDYINEYDNLFIIKAITKFFSMPGIRLGYGVCKNEILMNEMWNMKQPWSVNTFAENICFHIFNDKEFIQSSKKYFEYEIKRVVNELKNIKNIKVFDSYSNFILIKLNDIKSYDFKEKLFKEKGILIRDASNFKGLDDRYIRVAVKGKRQNDILIKALKEMLGG